MTVHPTPLSSRLAGVLLALLGLLLCAVLGAYLTVRHVLWPRIDDWRPELVAQVERQLGRPVAIDALRPSWEGLHPALQLDGLRIDGPDGEPRLAVASAFARVSWRSLARGHLRFATLRLSAPQVVVERLAPGRFAVAGLALAPDGPDDGRALDWLLTQGEVDVDGAAVTFIDRSGALAALRVDGVSLLLRGAGRRHQASLSIAHAGDAARSLSAVAEVYRPPFSRPSAWRTWTGEAHASGQGLELARIAELAGAFGAVLPAAAASAEGRVDALAWLRFAQSNVVDATLKARAERAATQLEAGRLEFDAIGGELHVERQRDGGHVLRVARLSIADGQGFSLAADGDAELGLDRDRVLRSAWIRLKAFDAASALGAVRRLPLATELRERVVRVGVSGEVRDLTLRWTRPDAPLFEVRPADRSDDTQRARPAAPRFELGASFERFGLQLGETADGRRLPGFGNLSGTLRASDHDGSLTIAARRATLGLPGVFDDPTFPVERLDADVEWAREAEASGWRVSVPRLTLVTADARGTASGTWRSAPAGPGVVDATARVERLEARQVARYLPSRMAPQAREWVERALVGGAAEDLRVELRGDLRQFPFHEPADGVFRVKTALRDVVLAYAPQWPRIEQIRGEAVIDGTGLSVLAPSAVTEGVRLADMQARLPDWREPVVALDGRAVGAAQDMLRFVNASPLAANVSAFTRDLRIGGDARLALRLALPLRELAATKTAVSVELPGNDVALDSTLPPFGGVSGRLEFTERGLTLPELRGTLLGGPIRVEGRPAGEGRMRIEASGSVDAAGLRQIVDNALTRRLEGRTDYRASVDVERRASTLRIESDLVGLASGLPAPFDKRAADAWPLRVVSRPLAPADPAARPPGDRLDVRVRDDIAFSFERERDPATERLLVRRAGFAVGGEPMLRDGSLSVLLQTRVLDVDAWRAVIGDGELERLERQAKVGGVAGMSLVPDLVSVVADDLRIAGRDLHEVVVGASRVDGRWRANMASREIEGHFVWRDARPGERIGTLTARFARLVLPRSRVGEVESALSASAGQLPGLDIAADELVLGTLPMGALALTATNGGTAEQPVWNLDRLSITNPSARLQARGQWSFVGSPRPRPGVPTASIGTAPAGSQPLPTDGRRTALDFELEVLDAGRLLAGLGLKDTVHGGAGTLGGSVHWQGSPVAIDFGSLDGAVELAIGKGEFLKVDPGAAKLIGVLNMQSLPKRLSGDFRDLFGEGFAFDTIDGRVRIDNGVAYSEEFRIRGLQAQVTIRGQADLQRETQRLNVEVVPELNAGIASIAFGAMVNPLIGLGSFAAQYVLRKPLQQALAYDVDVTGPWTDPTVSERNRRQLPGFSSPSP
jgi:uncharacterized protein (TIGR02099 family)